MDYKTDHSGWLKKFFDYRDPESFAARFRTRRMSILKPLLENLPKPVKILDVGGLEGFWERAGMTENSSYIITIINLEQHESHFSNIRYVRGDATRMGAFHAGDFDFIFSNSVIEHVGDYKQQRKMGEEIHRLGKRYFIQTPNRYFPIEPHFFTPFFQFFPLFLKVWFIQHFNLGWFHKTSDYQKALEIANSVQLLSKKEFKNIFPQAQILEEKFFLLTKSFIALFP